MTLALDLPHINEPSHQTLAALAGGPLRISSVPNTAVNRLCALAFAERVRLLGEHDDRLSMYLQITADGVRHLATIGPPRRLVKRRLLFAR